MCLLQFSSDNQDFPPDEREREKERERGKKVTEREREEIRVPVMWCMLG